MSRVDSTFYSRITQPSKTRRAVCPIDSFPLEKLRLSHKRITDPYYRVHNSQGFGSSDFRDADADAGKYYYIHIDSYDTMNTQTIINEVSPLLINPTNFIPGAYYTYVIASVLDTSIGANRQPLPLPQLYATRTMNMFEFGTKHHQIMYRKAIQDKQSCQYRIYAAGEIMCVNENTLIFNFISGTYKMKRYISGKRAIYEQAYITYMMEQTAPDYSNILFQNEPLITIDALPLKKNELSRLKRHRVPMYMFDTQKQCSDMKYAIIRHVHETKKRITNEEINEIYRKIHNQI